MTRLCVGDFREGWKRYEYRLDRKKSPARRPNYPRPIWRGDKNLHGKTVFLPAEQGHGDAIQFVRYAPLLAGLGAKVLVGVHRPLAALIASVPVISQVIGDGEAIPDFDLYCPLLSLPLAFETELATIPSSVPYIQADQARVAKWQGRVPAERPVTHRNLLGRRQPASERPQSFDSAGALCHFAVGAGR